MFTLLVQSLHEPAGSVALIHLESHFTDEAAGLLRAETYGRLRRHWQFINELMLFEIEDHKRYGINIYGCSREPHFLQAASIYHPSTVEASLKHDGSGTEPGIKDDEGRWDVRPHASRIVRVTDDVLRSWHAALESESVPVLQTRMVYAVNRSTSHVLEKVSRSRRLSALSLNFSPGWHEKNDRTKGRFDSKWGVPESWDSVILQGPHIHIGNPFFKSPNPTMLHNQDWTEVDLEELPSDAIPTTSYKPQSDRAEYSAAYTHWEVDGKLTAARDHYRFAWRNMAANTGERTLISSLIPPGAAHIHGVSSLGTPGGSVSETVIVAAVASSLIGDFAIRSVPKSTINLDAIGRLPLPSSQFTSALALRALRLNCLTSAYASLWESLYDPCFGDDAWTGGNDHAGRAALGDVSPTWSVGTPLRRAIDRRQAQLEIDALVAVALGVTADELVTIYRTQFPVLAGYDRADYLFDINGRLVPTAVRQAWRRHGETPESATFPIEERTVNHVASGASYQFDLPFRFAQRDEDLRRAHEEFQARLVPPS